MPAGVEDTYRCGSGGTALGSASSTGGGGAGRRSAGAERVVRAERAEVDDEVLDKRGQGQPGAGQPAPNSSAAMPAADGDAALVPLKQLGA